ncbi:hypothetical protein [Chitinolyticbacter albus]|uniref:hypothetical protein n=1 Tax=Chitinolyticbacter albus TaxID=2961951 RepID=UPI00210E1B00|nr:hypothetical protein [Chitinolyticbacter albus]
MPRQAGSPLSSQTLGAAQIHFQGFRSFHLLLVFYFALVFFSVLQRCIPLIFKFLLPGWRRHSFVAVELEALSPQSISASALASRSWYLACGRGNFSAVSSRFSLTLLSCGVFNQVGQHPAMWYA